MSIKGTIHCHYVLLSVIACLIAAGCATQPDAVRVLHKTMLPAHTGDESQGQINLEVLFLLNEEGEVTNLRLLNTSGDAVWDRAAVDSLRKWTFTKPPAGKSEYLFKSRIAVRIESPAGVPGPSELWGPAAKVGLLWAETEDLAAALYQQLEDGASFHSVMTYIGQTGSDSMEARILDTFPVNRYPKNVTEAVRNLSSGEYTRPMAVRDGYVIVTFLQNSQGTVLMHHRDI
ncbi:TonB family protein [Balneolales bacterium ANBcel1]|nr:TonB family protein [Balneolales bacterium ANBcel1]